LLSQKTRYGEMLVNVAPADPDSVSYQPPVCTLFWCGTEKTRKPDKRRDDFAAIREHDAQCIFVGLNSDRGGVDFNLRSRHPIVP
jgi:hypothetical protein